ncbi:gluconolactonase [Anaerocolumna jejuensis]|uniref:gluconolactonase n=1 Tax=Anaerocolumna jejuensis TaxID=259063 RepID=UPI003F7BB411
MDKVKKQFISILAMLSLSVTGIAISWSVPAAAASNVPYDTYNYDYWDDIYDTPAAYVPDGSYSGSELGVGGFSKPQDLYIDDQGRIYIADTGNNRIVVLTAGYKQERIIESFDNNGTADGFASPTGLYVTSDNRLYVADMDHNRVVVLNEDGTLNKIIANPQSEILPDGFVFLPMKVTVDYADRIYVIAKNMFQGIMCFDETGVFTGFTGTINVTITPYEKFWRKFSTKEQRSRQAQFIPTEFTGVDMAPDGFVFATNVDSNGLQSIRRLNPKGQDVIKKNRKGKLSGDFGWSLTGDYSGASRITDVVYRGEGIYSVIDSTRGRIFTYDSEGNLLYIFGGKGSQKGTFKNPAAIEASGDKILALDSERAEVMIFRATEYGSLINKAIALRYDGDESSAVKLWEKVLKLDSNFELAYVGIGKSYLAAGENKKAMGFLKLGMNREYYSIAYKRYRDDILKEHLNIILTGIAVAAAALIAAHEFKKRKKEGGVRE